VEGRVAGSEGSKEGEKGEQDGQREDPGKILFLTDVIKFLEIQVHIRPKSG
jgi:hypothetical protein